MINAGDMVIIFSTLATTQDVLLQSTHRQAGGAKYPTGTGVLVNLLDSPIRELGRPGHGR